MWILKCVCQPGDSCSLVVGEDGQRDKSRLWWEGDPLDSLTCTIVQWDKMDNRKWWIIICKGVPMDSLTYPTVQWIVE